MKVLRYDVRFWIILKKRGHQVVPSSSLVPGQDPTLLFTNAGMVQFKETFFRFRATLLCARGERTALCQAGGKHNDLENVGYTARHHTFFEMLGNLVLVITLSAKQFNMPGHFLTEILQLLLKNYGSPSTKTTMRLLQFGLMKCVFHPIVFRVAVTKIIFGRWEIPDLAALVPRSFMITGEDIPGGPPGSPDADGDRYIEIWNLVFMQYNRDKSGQLHPLPKPSVDTGMGLSVMPLLSRGCI